MGNSIIYWRPNRSLTDFSNDRIFSIVHSINHFHKRTVPNAAPAAAPLFSLHIRSIGRYLRSIQSVTRRQAATVKRLFWEILECNERELTFVFQNE